MLSTGNWEDGRQGSGVGVDTICSRMGGRGQDGEFPIFTILRDGACVREGIWEIWFWILFVAWSWLRQIGCRWPGPFARQINLRATFTKPAYAGWDCGCRVGVGVGVVNVQMFYKRIHYTGELGVGYNGT